MCKECDQLREKLSSLQGELALVKKQLVAQLKTSDDLRILYEGAGHGFGNRMADWAVDQQTHAQYLAKINRELGEKLEQAKEVMIKHQCIPGIHIQVGCEDECSIMQYLEGK